MAAVRFTIVDTRNGLSAALKSLRVSSAVEKPVLYVDLEGINLCRHGSISIMQMYHSEEDHVYLIDVHTLEAVTLYLQTASRR